DIRGISRYHRRTVIAEDKQLLTRAQQRRCQPFHLCQRVPFRRQPDAFQQPQARKHAGNVQSYTAIRQHVRLEGTGVCSEPSAPAHGQRYFQDTSGGTEPERRRIEPGKIGSAIVMKIGKWYDAAVDLVAELFEDAARGWADAVSSGSIDGRPTAEI